MTDVVRLWPGTAPGSRADVSPEVDTFLGDAHLARNVSVPTLTPYLPSDGNGTAVIVAPGGGFQFLSMEDEGTTVAELLNKQGVTAFLLKYRLADTGETEEEFGRLMAAWQARLLDERGELRPVRAHTIDPDTEDKAYADGRQAVRLLRESAGDWGIDPARIGFLGFSAGAFVATAAAQAEHPAERPDFVAPIYGGGVLGDVPADAPPLFCAVAADDALCLDTCLETFHAWRAAGRPAELHVYEKGGHGFGTRAQGLPADGWSDRFLDWMRSRDLIAGS